MREPVYMPWYERRRRKRRFRLVAVITAAALVGGLAAFRVLGGGPPEGTERAAAAEPTVDTAPPVVIIIDAGHVEPQRVHLELNRPARVLFVNEGSQFHDVIAEGLGIHAHIFPGARQESRVLPTEVGTFEGECVVGEHRERITFVVR